MSFWPSLPASWMTSYLSTNIGCNINCNSCIPLVAYSSIWMPLLNELGVQQTGLVPFCGFISNPVLFVANFRFCSFVLFISLVQIRFRFLWFHSCHFWTQSEQKNEAKAEPEQNVPKPDAAKPAAEVSKPAPAASPNLGNRERTFLMLKPDAVHRGLAGQVETL